MVIAFIFFFGIVIGSFLNVCILRIPEDFSIVAPASRCPRCQTLINWYDNVPVFGTQTTVKWLFFTCLLIVLTITDLRVRLLPDLVNWPGFVAGLLFSAIVPPDDRSAVFLFAAVFHRTPPRPVQGLLDALLGAAFGSFLLWGVAATYERVRGREGMGMGDVKMMAMVGTFLGVRGAFLTILLGTLLGTLVGVTIIVALYTTGWQRKLAERASRRRLGGVNALRWIIASQYQLPLGTFLGIAALLVVYFGPKMLMRWSQMLG